MELIIIKLLFALVLFVGVLGAILPVLPGAPLSLVALVICKFLGYTELSWWVLGLFGGFTVLGILLDYLIPIVTTKKMGGTKYGIIGLIIGFLVGLIFSPFGFFSLILGPFLGALIGELLYDHKNHQRAFKSALGSIIGYILTSGYGLVLTLAMFFVYVIYDIILF